MRLLILTADDLGSTLPAVLPEAEILTAVDEAHGALTAAVVDPEMADQLDALHVPPQTQVVWWVPPDVEPAELLAMTDAHPGTVLFQGAAADVARTIRLLSEGTSGPAVYDVGTMDELWGRFRDTMLERLVDIDLVAVDAVEGAVDPDAAEAALLAAHNLHGSLGTFGLDRGSRLAAELETLLGPPGGDIGEDAGLRIAELTVEIRREIEEREPVTGEGAISQAPRGPRLLIVEPDRRRSEAMVAGAAARGLRPLVARDLAEAGELFEADRPAALIVDPDAGPGEFETLMKAAALGRPRVPVMVHSRSGDMGTRARAARLGARGFVEKATHPDLVVEGAANLIARSSGRNATVLVVDDDAAMLELVATGLRDAGFRVRALDQPSEFWQTLETVRPDLVVLDIDMPEYTGLQLCRMVRADTTWADLPIVLLTARTDLESFRRGYRAGADDFIPKPLQRDEFVARVAHRLDRTGLSDGRDPLTGVPRSRLFRSLLGLQLALAKRHDEPVLLTRLGLRSARRLPDFVESLRDSLGPEDLIGRWGTVDVVVARYAWDGSPPEEWLGDLAGAVAHIGTAEYPDLGHPEALLDAAERNLRPAGQGQEGQEPDGDGSRAVG